MKYLKISLFSFICALIFALAAEILSVTPILGLSVLSALICALFLIIWLCASIFHRFRYSLNIITIIIFFSSAVVSYIFQPEAVHIEELSDFANIHYISMVFIGRFLKTNAHSRFQKARFLV